MGFGSFNPVKITKGLVPGHKDYLDFGGDSSTGGGIPRVNQRTFDERFGANDGYSELYDAYRLNEESGIGNEDALLRRLKRAGLVDENGNVLSPEGYDPSKFDPTGDAAYTSDERRRLGKALSGPGSRNSFLIKNFEDKRAELAKAKMDEFKRTNIDPITKTLNQRIQEMLESPEISPEDYANMRSEAVSQARSQEAQRLNRAAATLGLSGMDPGSVAGAALMSQIVEETDARITSALRQFEMDRNALESRGGKDELGYATGLSTQMAQLETALTQGNLEQVFGIQNDLAGMIEAIDARDQALDAQREASRLGFYGSVAQGVGSAVPG
jgi:hypothetical protein